MSNDDLRKSRILTSLLAGLYALAYLAASWLDLFTTTLALTRPGTSEGNVYATSAGQFDLSGAWTITLIGGGLIIGCLLFAARRADRVDERWLEHPFRSFAKFYVNPFGRKVADRAPLHILSFVFGFVVLRLLAAGNNAMIWLTGTGPLGRLIGLLSHELGSHLAFWLVMGPLFYLVAFLTSPLAVRVIRSLAALERDEGATAPG